MSKAINEFEEALKSLKKRGATGLSLTVKLDADVDADTIAKEATQLINATKLSDFGFYEVTIEEAKQAGLEAGKSLDRF